LPGHGLLQSALHGAAEAGQRTVEGVAESSQGLVHLGGRGGCGREATAADAVVE
jgi:hypothetical protein